MNNIINAITGDAWAKFGKLLNTKNEKGVEFKVYCSPTVYNLIQDTLNDEILTGPMIISEKLDISPAPSKPSKPYKFSYVQVPFVGEFQIIEVGSLTGYFLMKKSDKNEQ